ncbi:hypothetical protein [Shinella sp.]|uniref:hypothetical protein n=1 Tax=Shinella sp. TaxID=1870904 RepID=UPI0028B16BBA|nr:hypothetical protein [Shinella sp.]
MMTPVCQGLAGFEDSEPPILPPRLPLLSVECSPETRRMQFVIGVSVEKRQQDVGLFLENGDEFGIRADDAWRDMRKSALSARRLTCVFGQGAATSIAPAGPPAAGRQVAKYRRRLPHRAFGKHIGLNRTGGDGVHVHSPFACTENHAMPVASVEWRSFVPANRVRTGRRKVPR